MPATLIKIDPWSIVKIIVVLLILGFLYLIRDVILILIVALIFAAIIDPLVDWFQRRKIPRFVGVLIIYLVIFSVFILAVVSVVPAIIHQGGILVQRFQTLGNILGIKSDQGVLETIRQFWTGWGGEIKESSRGIFSFLGSLVGQIFSAIMILVITFYICAEKKVLKKAFQGVIPEKYQAYTLHLTGSLRQKIGLWGRGQIILCLLIGVLSYIGLTILGVKYALVLALIAGVTEIIPWLGPFIGAIPAVILAFLQSPIKGLMVVVLYIFIQQVENNLIVPHVMRKAVGLNPLVVILALLIGGKIAGPIGALIAVPVATIVVILIKEIKNIKKVKDGEIPKLI